MPDHYTYPGTEVLVNIPGYTDPALWKDAETLAVAARQAELLVTPIEGGFDLAHLRAIHAHLVQDVYAWGGQLRDTDTGPGGTGIAHCRPQFIPTEAERIFTALREAGFLRGRDADAFSQGLAWVWGETTVLHPFRDVNTRSQFVFFTQLAGEAGWVIDWGRIDQQVFAHARTVAIVQDEAGIDALLRPALRTIQEVDHADELREKMREAESAFFTRGRTAPRYSSTGNCAPHSNDVPETWTNSRMTSVAAPIWTTDRGCRCTRPRTGRRKRTPRVRSGFGIKMSCPCEAPASPAGPTGEVIELPITVHSGIPRVGANLPPPTPVGHGPGD